MFDKNRTPSNQAEQSEKVLDNKCDQEPNGHSGWAPAILCADERKFQKVKALSLKADSRTVEEERRGTIKDRKPALSWNRAKVKTWSKADCSPSNKTITLGTQPGQLWLALSQAGTPWGYNITKCEKGDWTVRVNQPPPSLAFSVSFSSSSSSSPVIRVMMRDSPWSVAQYQPELIDNLVSVQRNHIIWQCVGRVWEFNLGCFVSSGAGDITISRWLGSRML